MIRARWSTAQAFEILLFAATLLAVAIFVLVGAGRPVWQDEAATIQISSQSFAGIVESLRRENNFPLYFFLLSIWIRCFGDSEIALRLLSAIFYLAGGAAAFALGRCVSSTRRGAWYSAFFYLLSPLAIRQAQNIRMYSLLGLLSALSTLLFVRLFFGRSEPRPSEGVKKSVGRRKRLPHQDATPGSARWDRRFRLSTPRLQRFFHSSSGSGWSSLLFTLLNAAGLLTHIWFAFVLAAQLLAVFLFERRRLRACLAGMALAGLPLLVLWAGPFLDQIHNGASNWMAMYPTRLLLLAPIEFYGLPAALVYYAIAAYSWAAADTGKRPRMVPLLSLLFAVSLAIPLIVSLARPIYFPGRYAVIALPPLAALLAAVLSGLFPRVLLPLLCFPLLAFEVANQVAHRDDLLDADTTAGQSDRTTARFLLQHAAPGDVLVFTSLTRPAADYYLHRAHAQGRFVEISFPNENETHPGWADSVVAPDRRDALESEAAATATRL